MSRGYLPSSVPLQEVICDEVDKFRWALEEKYNCVIDLDFRTIDFKGDEEFYANILRNHEIPQDPTPEY